MAVQYLTYQQIDKTKWDECINESSNGLIYGHSFYLDAMAKNWDGLVLNDYEAIMPLPWNKKYGICYLYQPPFTACLGIFGNTITADLIHDFFQAIPKKFKYWDFCLNAGNLFKLRDFNLYQRMNYVLSLANTYDNLYKNYNENIQRNIKKSEQSGNILKKNIAVSEVIELAKLQIKNFSNLADDDFIQFEKLCEILHKQGKLKTYGIYSSINQLIASSIFFIAGSRAYYILPGNHPNGKTLGASHAMIDSFIKDHAQQNLLLDFEGSDVPSLAFFYSSFGAMEENYSAIKLNRLPKWVKWFKK